MMTIQSIYAKMGSSGFQETDPVGDYQGPQLPSGPTSIDPYNSDSAIMYFLAREKDALILIAALIALSVILYFYLRKK